MCRQSRRQIERSPNVVEAGGGGRQAVEVACRQVVAGGRWQAVVAQGTEMVHGL